jgi:hypothetical protein
MLSNAFVHRRDWLFAMSDQLVYAGANGQGAKEKGEVRVGVPQDFVCLTVASSLVNLLVNLRRIFLKVGGVDVQPVQFHLNVSLV